MERMLEESQSYQTQRSTRSSLVFYDDRIVLPRTLGRTIIMLLHKGHAVVNKMTTAVKLFLWPRMARDMQQKCEECTPCKMAVKNNKAQIPMAEINSLPPVVKTNQEIKLDSIGSIGFKHRGFYILISIDRYSRRPTASICETPTGKTAKK